MRTPIALLLACGAILACGGDIDPSGAETRTISQRTFAAVVRDLSIARIETHPDTAAYEARRAAILERYDVSERDLWAFVRARGGNEDRIMRAYAGLGGELDSLFGERPPDRFPQPAETLPGTPDAVADTLPGG